MRATKIVATIGPASSSPDVLTALIKAGVNVVRLNFSHGQASDHIARAKMVRDAAAQCGVEVAIMADLQGPKIRVGKFEQGKVDLVVGQTFILDANCMMGNQERCGLDYLDLPKDVHAGDTLLLNDGLIRLIVLKVSGSEIHTEVIVGGELSNNKGINRQGGGLSAPALTAKDMEDIKTAVGLSADYIAVSFPKNRTDMEMARQLVAIAATGHANKPGLIAKIERVEAITNLEEIILASDGIMVARGDLAVEVGVAAVPALQKHMIKTARQHNRTVITATQMMESMIHQAVPTRAEVSDVANAVLDGTDAVMLSAETAAGKYPVETVVSMVSICIEAEKAHQDLQDASFGDMCFTRIDQTIANAALFCAHHYQAKVICALTESGSTALWMSRHNIHTPIYALTPSLSTERKLALYRNVHTVHLGHTSSFDEALVGAQAALIDKGIAKLGDVVVVTSGEPMGTPGGTNTLKLIRLN